MPIELGVRIIGWTTVIDGALVMRQIYSVSDDARDDGEMAPPIFYIVSYMCWLPFLAGTAAFINYKRNDTAETRDLMIKGNMTVIFGIIAIYVWFLLYFLSIGETDLMEKDMIMLIVLGFAAP